MNRESECPNGGDHEWHHSADLDTGSFRGYYCRKCGQIKTVHENEIISIFRKFHSRGKWPTRWYPLIWGAVGALTFLSGFVSSHVVTMIVGIMIIFGAISSHLMFSTYDRSEHKVKRALEIGSTFVVIGIVVYGYAITGSLVLGVITLFIAAMFVFAFVALYLLPKIRKQS